MKRKKQDKMQNEEKDGIVQNERKQRKFLGIEEKTEPNLELSETE